jgi:hypothetical protein
VVEEVVAVPLHLLALAVLAVAETAEIALDLG